MGSAPSTLGAEANVFVDSYSRTLGSKLSNVSGGEP